MVKAMAKAASTFNSEDIKETLVEVGLPTGFTTTSGKRFLEKVRSTYQWRMEEINETQYDTSVIPLHVLKDREQK